MGSAFQYEYWVLLLDLFFIFKKTILSGLKYREFISDENSCNKTAFNPIKIKGFFLYPPARSLSFSKEIKITPSDIHLNDATLSSVNKRLQLHSGFH
jgi:hypothetical protein